MHAGGALCWHVPFGVLHSPWRAAGACRRLPHPDARGVGARIVLRPLLRESGRHVHSSPLVEKRLGGAGWATDTPRTVPSAYGARAMLVDHRRQTHGRQHSRRCQKSALGRPFPPPRRILSSTTTPAPPPRRHGVPSTLPAPCRVVGHVQYHAPRRHGVPSTLPGQRASPTDPTRLDGLHTVAARQLTRALLCAQCVVRLFGKILWFGRRGLAFWQHVLFSGHGRAANF